MVPKYPLRSYSGTRECSLVPGKRLVTMETRALSADTRWPDGSRERMRRDSAFAEEFLQAGAAPIADGYSKPRCFSCHACLPVRVLVQEFNETAEHRRALAKNADLAFTLHEWLPHFDREGNDEYSNLYSQFLNNRFPHVDANDKKIDYFQPQDAANQMAEYANYPGMRPMHIQARDADGVLHGVNIFHQVNESAYDTIFFYDLSRKSQGLGHALTLSVLRQQKAAGYKHHYLGFWTRAPGPYSWKDKYAPLELRVGNEWKVYRTTSDVHKMCENPAQPYPVPKAP